MHVFVLHREKGGEQKREGVKNSLGEGVLLNAYTSFLSQATYLFARSMSSTKGLKE